MIIREVLMELESHGIKVTNQAVRALLKKRYGIVNQQGSFPIIFSEKIGRQIVDYYLLKYKNQAPN